MSLVVEGWVAKSRLRILLEHFSHIEDLRDVRRVYFPLPEVLLLVVCGTMADCDDYENIAAWGEAVPDKANELTAIPTLLERLGADDGLKGALISIDAVATNATIADAIGPGRRLSSCRQGQPADPSRRGRSFVHRGPAGNARH